MGLGKYAVRRPASSVPAAPDPNQEILAEVRALRADAAVQALRLRIATETAAQALQIAQSSGSVPAAAPTPDDAAAALSKIQAARAAVQELAAQAGRSAEAAQALSALNALVARAAADRVPTAVPNAVPGAVPATPPTLFPAGPTELAYIQPLLLELQTTAGNAVIRSGDSMTGALSIGTSGSPAVTPLILNGNAAAPALLTLSAGGATKAIVGPTGNASFGGSALVAGRHFEVKDLPIRFLVSGQPYIYGNGSQSGVGIVIDKPDKTNIRPHGIMWTSQNAPVWRFSMDYNTNNNLNGGNGSTYLAMFDFTAGIQDDGSRPYDGVDCWSQTTHEAVAAAGVGQGTKWCWSARGAGSQAAYPSTFLFEGCVGLDGAHLSGNFGAGRDSLVLVQRAAGHNKTSVSFDSEWRAGVDLTAANLLHFGLFDIVNNKQRLTLRRSASLLAEAVIGGTSGSGAVLTLTATNDPSFDNVVQSLLYAGWTLSAANRSVNVQYIRDSGGNNKLYALFGGGLGAGSTAATPVVTSTSDTFGIEGTDNLASLVAAPSGTNTTIVRPLRWNAAGQVAVGGGIDALASLVVTRPAAQSNPTASQYLRVVGVADTGLTAEAVDVRFSLDRTVSWAAGASVTDQRAIRITPPTYAAAGAATITNASTLFIEGQPLAGTNMTLTNRYALYVNQGLARFNGDGTHVWELPADATNPTGGGATGRIPIRVGGATKYLAYYG